MSLKKLMLESLKDNVADRFELKHPKNIKDVEDSLMYILNQYGSREMGGIVTYEYINDFPKLGKDFISKYKIKSKDDFIKLMKKWHSKARKGKGKERQEANKKWDDFKTEFNMNSIEQLAEIQSKSMDDQIKLMDYINDKLKKKFDVEYNPSMKHLYKKEIQDYINKLEIKYKI